MTALGRHFYVRFAIRLWLL